MNISEEINALPQHLRNYIHNIETCVPAHLVQENMALKENVKALEAQLQKYKENQDGTE